MLLAASRRKLLLQSSQPLLHRFSSSTTIVAGYVGTNYIGLSSQKSRKTQKFNTVLNELQLAAPSSQITSTMKVEPQSHAKKVVLLSESNNSLSLSDLNANLPSDIRAFSCTTLSSPKHNYLSSRRRIPAPLQCISREYEYYIPSDYLQKLCSTINHSSSTSSSVAVHQRYHDALKIFCGSFDLHNFSNFRKDGENKVYTLSRSEKTRQVIYVSKSDGNDEMLRYRIRGPAFLQHQIRAIVGTCIAVACEALPLSYAIAALVSRDKMEVPLAPAHGLVLVNAFYDSGTSQDDLMSQAELTRAEEFFDNEILPSIASSWDNDNNNTEFEEVLKKLAKTNTTMSLEALNQVALDSRSSYLEKEVTQHQYVVLRRSQSKRNRKDNSGFPTLLPKGFGTDLCCRYPQYLKGPGESLWRVQRVLVNMILKEELPITINRKELLAYIDGVGIPALLSSSTKQ